MKDRILQILGIILLAWLFIYIFGNQNQLKHRNIYVSGQTTGNDLVGLLQDEGARVYEYGSVEDALDKAKPGSAVLLLSNEYPEKTQEISTENLETIKSKNLRYSLNSLQFLALRPLRQVQGPENPNWKRSESRGLWSRNRLVTTLNPWIF